MDLDIFVDIGLSVFAVLILRNFFRTFFVKKNKKRVLSILAWWVYFLWQIVDSEIIEIPAGLNLVMVIFLTIIIALIAYAGSIWKRIIFSISFNVIAILLETVCGYTFMVFGIDYMIPHTSGSLISKLLLFIIIILLESIFDNVIETELSRKYSLLLLLIPLGSIYVILTLFFSNVNQKSRFLVHSLLSSFILLGINIIVFFVYYKLANETEVLRLNTVYEQQMDLYDKHMIEKEEAMLQFRNSKHDLKQKLFVLIDLAEREEYYKIIEFVHELIDEKGIDLLGIAKSGNSAVDSIINYKYSIAQKNGISFEIDLSIPIKWQFKGSDICVILGNAIDNAIEAAEKVKEYKKSIKLAMRYIQNNLSIVIINSYDGNLRRGKNGRILTTKSEPSNHGIGLQSIKKTVEKYNGVIQIENSENEFCLKLLLYGPSEKLHGQPE
jgi:two-component system sensor histidine kinase AgrC